MKCLSTILFTCSLLFGAGAAQATILNFTALLTGANEVPPNASPGTGVVNIAIDDVAHTMFLDVTFSGLLGNTTAAHIHCCTAVPLTGTAGVATTTPTFPGFPAGVTSGSYNATFNLLDAGSYNAGFITNNGGTPSSAEVALLAGMVSGRSYFNLHSTAFPGGEIRGFLVAVPEPGSIALFGLGAVSLFAFMRRRRER